MRAMKDSGIEWIGEIPQKWEICRIKYNTYVKGRIGWQGLKAEEFIDDGIYLITGTDFNNGKVEWNRCYHITKERYEEAPEIQIQEGDLLITKDGTVGKLAFIDFLPYKASLNSHLLVLRPTSGLYINKYLYWVFTSEIFTKYTNISQDGTIMFSLSQEKIKNFSFPIPKIPTQTSIINFLDYKCAQIDSIIEKQQQAIEKLTSYKKSVITEAVTKGLNNNAPMKDSGVEWIGEIPEGWIPIRVKYVTSQIGSGKTPAGGSEVYKDQGVMFIRSQNIHNDGLRLDDIAYIDDEIHEEMKYTKVQQFDILLNITGASIGRSCMFPICNKEANVSQHVCILRPVQKIINPFFFERVMQSDYMFNQVYNSQDGISREGINFGSIKNLFIALPDLEKQKDIANYLEKRCQSIEKTIKKRQELVERLNAYKKSLIYEAVTGKIEV